MELFNKILQIFKSEPRDSGEGARDDSGKGQRWLKGYLAFKKGKEHHFSEPVRAQEALDCFDIAIGHGFENAEVYGLRGSCLQRLHFDLDAIDDFNKAVALEPEDCNNYFQRSFSKSAVGDFEGCVADLEGAIRLSKVKSALNSEYDRLAKGMGHRNGVTAMYEIDLVAARAFLGMPDAFRERIAEQSKPRRLRQH